MTHNPRHSNIRSSESIAKEAREREERRERNKEANARADAQRLRVDRLQGEAGITEKQARRRLQPKFRAEEEARRRPEQQLALIRHDPSAFGLETPNVETPLGERPTNLEVTEEAVPPAPQGNFLTDIIPTETGTIRGDILQSLEKVSGSPAAQAILATTGVAAGWRLAKGGATFVNAKLAVQAGNAAKNSKTALPAINKIRDGAIAFSALAFGADRLIGGIGGLFTKEVDGQQQALNTLGQVTSSVVGDSTSAAGDWRKGINELRHIESEILRLEGAIKEGTIKSASLKFDGQIIDINADIFDQLATVQEGIRDIQSFAVAGAFPELSELEIQQQLRILESEGFLKPVDLTVSRRDVQSGSEIPSQT
jgi:hypothetical protein